jgi:hypothetical protein
MSLKALLDVRATMGVATAVLARRVAMKVLENILT